MASNNNLTSYQKFRHFVYKYLHTTWGMGIVLGLLLAVIVLAIRIFAQ
jgi:hypothetical protein